MNPSTIVGRGTCFTLGYVGHRGYISEPITVVQCCSAGEEEGWDAALLHQLLQAQHLHQERLLSAAIDTGVIGEYGRGHPFLNNGLQEWVLEGTMMLEPQQYTGNLGFYEFTHMPFGLCNVLATFQCLMQNMLGELNLTYCVIYLDDVIVFGCTEKEHLGCLQGSAPAGTMCT